MEVITSLLPTGIIAYATLFCNIPFQINFPEGKKQPQHLLGLPS